MDILKDEINKKKRLLDEKKLLSSNRKYFRKTELLKQEEEAYWGKYQSSAESSSEQSELQPVEAQSASHETDSLLPRKEVVRRLRERGHPVWLFGEGEGDAFGRLRRLELLEPEGVGQRDGFRNDLQGAVGRAEGEAADDAPPHDVAVDDVGTSIEEIQEEASKTLGKGNASDDAKVILKYLRFLLQLWGESLNGRALAEKEGVKGRGASATYAQTREYIRPLFRLLRTEACPEDILEHLVLIANFLLDRNYVKANDAYLEMAIGNAPWPIGVTMVGIHARTGREKIFSRNIAHVLNDETQRKFIQALKRLMTQCQRFFPTDPSRSVEYNA